MSLIRLQNACIAFGHVALLDEVELNIHAKERVCLIGRNGTGKSTLLRALLGEQTLDSGTLWKRSGLRIARLAQEVPSAMDETIFATVTAGLGDHSDLLNRYHESSAALAAGDSSEATLNAFGELQSAIEDAGAWESSQRAESIISRLDLPQDAKMSECSGGVRRRAMLGQALVSEPDLLLLDEPTNHLDIEAIATLEKAVLEFQGAVLFITHDRTFIDRVATRIIELDRGNLNSYEGSYASYKVRKAAELAAEEDAARKFDKNLAQEEVWIRQGIKARRTRNEGRVRRLESLRKERSERRSRQGQVSMALDKGEASGKRVIELDGVCFAYTPDSAPIVKNFSTLIQRGDRIGIIGANGTGKTTLLRLLLKTLEPTSGEVEHGTSLKIAYFDQERAVLNLEQTVRDNLSEGSDTITIGDKSRHVVSYLSDFLFSPARIHSPVKTLSGGERNRLLLAKLFAKPANLLVLDEPTNDLDVETLELLEELLLDFPGTLLLVSHDRSFLDSTVTQTLILEPGGHVQEFVGGYTDWHNYKQGLEEKNSAQKGNAKANTKKTASKTKSAPAQDSTPKNTPAKKKLSNKEQMELNKLPQRIEKLEQQQQTLTEKISEPDFYQQEQPKIQASLDELTKIEAELQVVYQRWEELET